MKRLNMLKALGIMVLVLLAAIPMISSAAAEQNVCRNLPAEAQPGDEITVELAITVDGGDRIMIDDMAPAGWTVTGASNGGIPDGNYVRWVKLEAPADITYTYTVQIPGDAALDLHTFSGDYNLGSGVTVIDCDTQVEVVGEPGDSGEQNVCRNLPAEAQPGDEITVELAITVDGGDRIMIDDMAPAGWTVTGASNGGIPDGNYVRWVKLEAPADITYTYTVQIPGDAALDLHTFSGDYNLGSGVTVIDCDTQVEVVGEPGDSGEQNVCRNLPAEAQPGDEITVELAITVDGADRIIIDDMVPAGWTVTGASNGGVPDGNHVRWTKLEAPADTTYTYTVQIPGDAALELHTFSGEYNLGSGVTEIDCDTQVEVVVLPTASAVRTLPASVERGEQFTVSIDVLDYGTTGSVVETIPESFTYVSSTLDTPHVIVVDNTTVTFNLGGETNFEYTVTASNTEGPYTFSGVLMDESTNEVVVSGDTSIDVVLPDGIELSLGWNFISVPSELIDPSVDNVFTGITSDATLTYYNAETHSWGGVATIEPMKGYWIYIPMDTQYTQVILDEVLEPVVPVGPVSPSSIQLYEGWNTIGYTDSTATLSAELTLAAIDDCYTSIWGPWNPGTKSYEYFGHNGQTGVIDDRHVGTDVFEMSPYNGYWVYITQDCVLNSIGS